MIPHRLYTDPLWFEEERKRLRQGVWQFLCLADEVPADGDWLRRTVLGVDLFLQNVDGDLRAFRNVCSHRSFPLRRGRAGHGRMECGFHGWVYDRDGVPAGIPRSAELFDLDRPARERLALTGVRVETVGRFVFVGFGGSLPPLRADLGTCASVLAAVSSRAGAVFLQDEASTAANWKLCWEITLDDYHPQVVHPTTFGDGTLKAFQCVYGRGGRHSWFLKRRDPDWTFESYWLDLERGVVDTAGYKIHHVFPNFLIALMPESIIVSRYEPAGPATTLVGSLQLDWEARPLSPERLGEIVPATQTLLAEDRAVAEALEEVPAPERRPPVFGAFERRIQWFHEDYAAFFEAALPPAQKPE